jgi:hypothetical protein
MIKNPGAWASWWGVGVLAQLGWGWGAGHGALAPVKIRDLGGWIM